MTEITNIIVHPKDNAEANTLKTILKALKIKFEIPAKPYKKEFVTKVLKSSSEAKSGKVTRVKKGNLKEFLDL